MVGDDRPSWIGDTLTGAPLDPLTEDLAALTAGLDHLDELLTRYERESDPPPDPPPAAAAKLAA